MSEEDIKKLSELEGLTFEEARLTYAARKRLPTSAFCGPERSYPAHDAAHVRNALARLMRFKPKGWKRILSCVCGRAKKFGVVSKNCPKTQKKKVQETVPFLPKYRKLMAIAETSKIQVEKFIETVALYEGMVFDTFEEARLTYARRQKLPTSAFCGPDRSYPAHDAPHVRNAFVRLATFGGKLPKATRAKIYKCLRRRAKRYGVEHNAKNYKWKGDGSPNPAYKKRVSETVAWFETRHKDVLEKCSEC